MPYIYHDKLASCLVLLRMSYGVICRLILGGMFLAVAACSDKPAENPASNSVPSTLSGDWQSVALPDLSEQPIHLRVANVINPRFRKLSSEQTTAILQRTVELLKQHFDIDVEFTQTATLSIDELFELLTEEVVTHRRREIVDLTFVTADVREKMQQSLFETLSLYAGDKQSVIDFATPFLLKPDVEHEDFISLSYALVDTLVARLSYWQDEQAPDGKPVLDASGYHEWVWWDSLGYGDLPYDVLITNQLVASAEYYGMDVHSSIRGGLTAGTTSYNSSGRLGSYVYIMVYPMINDTELLTMLRQDETYNDEQIINYSAALLTHELGHMLLHLGHPFGEASCVMSPTVMLGYRRWYDAFDAEKCTVGSSTPMTPGAATIEYNRGW